MIQGEFIDTLAGKLDTFDKVGGYISQLEMDMLCKDTEIADLRGIIKDAPIKRLFETDAEFIEAYKLWYRERRHKAFEK